MLHAVATAAIEVAEAAILPLRLSDALCDLHQSRTVQALKHGAAGRYHCPGGSSVIGAGLLMANKAVEYCSGFGSRFFAALSRL